MIYVEEIKDDIEMVGWFPSVKKYAVEKFGDWQKDQKGKLKVISVQKTNDGIFIVYEK